MLYPAELRKLKLKSTYTGVERIAMTNRNNGVFPIRAADQTIERLAARNATKATPAAINACSALVFPQPADIAKSKAITLKTYGETTRNAPKKPHATPAPAAMNSTLRLESRTKQIVKGNKKKTA